MNGETVKIDSIEIDDGVAINGGSLKGGIDLGTQEDTNGYRYYGDDDISAYTEQGVTTLVVDSSATYTDASDIDAEPVKADYDGMVEAMQSSENEFFTQYNTTVRIEAGKVVEIKRVYEP